MRERERGLGAGEGRQEGAGDSEHERESRQPQGKPSRECVANAQALLKEWVNQSQPENFLCVLICLRLLMREPLYQKVFHELEGVHSLAQTLVKLLAATDNNVLLGSLLALTSLAESHICKEKIGELTVVENLLMILQEYDMLSKRMAAELLRLLCADHQVREQIKIYEGIPILLSLLHSEHLKLVWSVVWILVQLCEDPESSTEIRIWGGIKQLLHILQGDRDFVSDRSSISSLSSANAAGRIQQQHISAELTPQEIQENTVSLQAACCAALTELVLNDTNAHQVVQCYAFRALRFLFSMERNRHLFRRLFSTEMFEMFIDIGHYVRDIAAYEKLVAAFHNLSVRKQGGQNLFALKEVNLHNPAFGKDKKDRDSSVEKIVSELTIIKEQICLALRYLHKEKRIVHRDLTPNNIMLGERDKVTITDFGLAKQKQENSKLMSVVGTILYTCPEIVKNEPYGEKADVWAVGCILYQMVTLNPPFYSSNMLSLATKIVEAVYEPVPEDVYSKKVTDIITWCLTPDPDLRPDIIEVSARISDVIMKYVDGLGSTQISMERKLERERKRTQKYFLEAKRSALSFRHQFSLFSEGQCDNSSSLNKSGASSLRVDSESHEGPSYIFQSTTVKDGDVKVSEKDVSEDNCSLEVTEKDVGSDEDLDMSDTSNSSSKDQTLRSIKRSISASETETQRYTRGVDSLSRRQVRYLQGGATATNSKTIGCNDNSQSHAHQLGRDDTERTASFTFVCRRGLMYLRSTLTVHRGKFLTKLPPALHQDFRRRAIERYKKLLFCPQSNPYQLKVEMKKCEADAPNSASDRECVHSLRSPLRSAAVMMVMVVVVVVVAVARSSRRFASGSG
ncbi:NEK10 kinase, partial [Polypterus senegalus]